MFATVNVGLIKLLLASRFCYSLAKQNGLPAIIGRVNSKTRTPVLATTLITAAIITAALWLPIETLALVTTSLLLFIFTMVNLALVRIKQRGKIIGDIFQVPLLLPIFGSILCGAFLLAQLFPVVIRLFLYF